MFRGKKGTDKPIEIFIALFVILAVAMVILTMFSSQIEQKKNEMEQQAQEERARQAMADLDAYCDTQCSKAHRSLKDKVAYCTSYYRGEIDINKNSMADYTMALDNIQGYCEDRIYCSTYRPCGSLDILSCRRLVCDYLDRYMGLGSATDPGEADINKANRLVGYDDSSREYEGLYQPGECWNRIQPEEKKLHWFYNFLTVPDWIEPGSSCVYRWGTCIENADTLQQIYPVADEWQADCVPTYEDYI